MIFETPSGKNLEVFYVGRNVAVKWVGGGELPAELAGQWTNTNELEQSVNRYIAGKKKKNDI